MRYYRKIVVSCIIVLCFWCGVLFITFCIKYMMWYTTRRYKTTDGYLIYTTGRIWIHVWTIIWVLKDICAAWWVWRYIVYPIIIYLLYSSMVIYTTFVYLIIVWLVILLWFIMISTISSIVTIWCIIVSITFWSRFTAIIAIVFSRVVY